MQLSVLRISFGAVVLSGWLLASSSARAAPPALPEVRPVSDPLALPGFLASYSDHTGADIQRVESHIAFDADSRPELLAADGPVHIRYRAEVATPTPGHYRFWARVAGRVTVTVNSAIVLTGSSDSPATPGPVPCASPSMEVRQPEVTIDVEYISPASVPPHLVVYWSGPDFGVEPLSADVARAAPPDQRSQQVTTGHELFHRLRCQACHTVSLESTGTPPGPNSALAPSLAQTPLPFRRQWLADWLAHSATDYPDPSSSHKSRDDFPAHPRWPLTEHQAAAIAAALLDQPSTLPAPGRSNSTADELRQSPTADPSPRIVEGHGDPGRGRHLLLTVGCLACHQWEQLGTQALWSGPDLTRLNRRRPAGFVARWLVDPATIRADHRMPRFPLSTTEVADLAAYLEAPDGGEPADVGPAPTAAPREGSSSGRDLLDHHCAACHRLPTDTSTTRTLLRLTKPIRSDRGCWTPTASLDRPHYALDERRLAALQAYLEWELDRRPSSATTEQIASAGPRPASLWREHQCGACHEHQSLANGLRSVADQVVVTEPGLAGFLPSMLPPSLRTAGDKFRDQTWDAWLRDSPPRRRPWLKVRMPDFHLPADESASVRRFFELRDRVPDAILELAAPATADNIPFPPESTPSPPEPSSLPESSLQVASQLVTAQGFGCISCHEIGGVRPAATTLTTLGPSLTGLGHRVRPTWFRRWLSNPARMVPNIEMPAIQRPVPQVLDGELAPQINLIWAALNDPAFQPPASSIVRTVQRSGVSVHREPAVLLTDCLKLPSSMILHPALCALPNRHNVLIDLGQARLSAWWAGPAAQQRTAGKSWFWEPAVSEYLISSGPASELTIVAPSGSFVPGRHGQFVAALDRWQSTSEHGLRLSYRVLCTPEGRPVLPPKAVGPFPEPLDEPQATEHGVERSQALLMHVDQQIQPAWAPDPSSSAARPPRLPNTDDVTDDGAEDDGTVDTVRTPSGFDRTVTVRPDAAWPDSQLRWYLAPADPAVRVAGSRTIEWSGSRASVTLTEPADGQLAHDEGGHYVRVIPRVGDQTPIRLVLHYRAELPPAKPQIADVAPAAPQPATLDGIPGYIARRLPLDDRWMPTAMSWSPAGELFVTSLKGEVWHVSDIDGDGWEDHSQPVSDELAAPYGIVAGSEYLDVVHKSALVRLTDGDRDGRYESAQTLASGWGHTDDYHDWTIGLLPDDQGGYYVATACQQDERPAAAAQWRGRVLHLRPRQPTDGDPRPLDVHVVSAGHRFPMGLVRFGEDSLLVTDNQGNFNPFNELNHVQLGRRFGFLNRWELAQSLPSDEVPPAVCLPHPWTRSVNGIAWLPHPWAGQLVGCEYDTRRLIRISLEKIGHVLQGAAYPLSIAQADLSRGFLGPVCCAVSPKGDLYVGGLRDSGWGGGQNTGELVRLTFAAESLPLGIARVTARANGFYVEFTQPVHDAWLEDPDTYQLESYFRVSTPAYGGDDQDRRIERVTQVRADSGRRGVELKLSQLAPGRVYALRLSIADPAVAERIFPSEAYYTLHRIPD